MKFRFGAWSLTKCRLGELAKENSIESIMNRTTANLTRIVTLDKDGDCTPELLLPDIGHASRVFLRGLYLQGLAGDSRQKPGKNIIRA